MAANNLRIIYENQVDYTNSTITASSTASTSTTAMSLKSDTRSLVWRSGSTTGSRPAVIIKSSPSSATPGVFSALTVSTQASSGSPTLFYTLTGIGGGTTTENTNAFAGTILINPSDSSPITGYVFRTYSDTNKTTLFDMETLPVIFSTAGTITPVLTNDFHRVPTSVDGLTATLSNSGTDVYVFDGSTPLRYNSTVTSAGVFTVSAVATGATVGAPSSGGNGAYAVYPAVSALSANTATVTYTVAGRTWANTSFTSTIAQTLVRSLTTSTDPTYSISYTSTVARALVHLSLPLTTNLIEAAALTYTNLSRGSTIRILGFGAATITLTGSSDTPVLSTVNTAILNTNHQLCCPFTSTSLASWTNLNYGTVTWGLDRQLARVYVAPANHIACRNVVLDIIDPNSTTGYIEASKLICGEYWSPTYNTEYGLSAGLRDDTENVRTEHGDLVTTNGVVYKTLNFNLNYLTPNDRNQMVNLLRNRGKRRGIFISLFPDNVEDYEQESLYQLYGKLSDGVDINHPYYQYFSTTIQLEEI